MSVQRSALVGAGWVVALALGALNASGQALPPDYQITECKGGVRFYNGQAQQAPGECESHPAQDGYMFALGVDGGGFAEMPDPQCSEATKEESLLKRAAKQVADYFSKGQGGDYVDEIWSQVDAKMNGSGGGIAKAWRDMNGQSGGRASCRVLTVPVNRSMGSFSMVFSSYDGSSPTGGTCSGADAKMVQGKWLVSMDGTGQAGVNCTFSAFRNAQFAIASGQKALVVLYKNWASYPQTAQVWIWWNRKSK